MILYCLFFFYRYFANVCELDVMFNLEKAHFIVEEMFSNGCIVETNILNSLYSLCHMDTQQQKEIKK